MALDPIEDMELADELGLDSEPLDEATTILDLISQALKTLFRIGVLVRKTAPTDRFKRALRASHFEFPAIFDIDYVREKHTKLKRHDRLWLAERLGRSIAQRRQFIKYCRDHQGRLAFDDEDIPSATVLQSSKATTLHPDKFQGQLNVEDDDDDEDDAISFISTSTTTDSLAVLKLPRLADLTIGDEPFECPICFTLQSIKREKSWR
jgi:hypothetical protein